MIVVLGRSAAVAAAIGLTLALLPAFAGAESADGVTKTDNVTPVAHFPYIGGAEVDFDGQRYLFAAQAALQENLRRESDVTAEGVEGGLRIIDTKTMREVGFLDCPGTDNYVRYLDPDVYNTPQGNREYVVIAFHGNACTREALEDDANTWGGYGAYNGIMIVDVKAKANPRIVSTIGHRSAHTVMPHPTRPYLFVLPGGLANGTTVSVPEQRATVSPTAIIDVSDPRDPVYVTEFTHNVQGCHDLGFTHDGEFAYCAGLGEVQVWDISGDRITNPLVVGAIHNPAIQFAHNVVVSPSGQYLAINDEAFGFHTCTGSAADLYGSLWIYDITVPNVPVLAGRVAPPGHPDPDHRFGTLEDTPVQYGWAQSWCAAHNYNWVPGTDIIVASWFAGGVTAHDISNPLLPELIAHYMPDDGVLWSGHYYGGYLVTGDMRRGTEILDVPELRAAEAEAAAEPASVRAASLSAPRIDLSAVLIPAVLPPRPLAPRDPQGGGFCVLP